jgi:predicted esterase
MGIRRRRELNGRRLGAALRVRGVIFGVALILLGVSGCGRKPAPKMLSSSFVKPFTFDVSLGPNRYHIDGYLVRSPAAGPRPAVLILNAGQGDAARCVKTHGNLALTLGIQVACISIPGYGHSSGPSRLVGPQAVAAAHKALDLLKARPDVDPKRIALWGIGDGAVAAGLLMDRGPRVGTVILQSGAYDLVRLWPEAPLVAKLEMLHQVWPSRRVLRERSVIENLPPRLKCRVLIIHGARDHRAPLSQAERLAGALRMRGAQVSTSYFPRADHDLGANAIKAASKFLRAALAQPDNGFAS